MQKVNILGVESIAVGSNLTEYIAQETVKARPCSAYVFISDKNVAPLHLDRLMNAFKVELKNCKLNSKILNFVISAGEVHKTREVKASVEDFMLKEACTRDTCLVALGGGVIGDLVGFVAANFMRGIPIIQVPTTLLAMVDSSVGGKTAIDTPHGKNLIGAFHQPTRIFIDIDYLKTLPRREFVNGLAEVIKTAAIWMEKDFDLLEGYPEKILSLCGGSSGKITSLMQDQESAELLTKVILGSVQVKAHVVTVDEKEMGLRGLLNFGHTVGHAIEAIVFPDLLHGECVSIGMVIEAEISRNLGHLNNISVGRLISCLQSYGLPVSLNDKIFKQRTKRVCSVDRMLSIMKVDKKNVGDKKRMVLLASIGKTYEPKASFVQDAIIRKVLSPAVQVQPLKNANTQEIKLEVPGSKSISNRALVMAALGKGPCRLSGLLHSDDVQVMLEALQRLVGITFNWENDGQTLLIEGGQGKLKVPQNEIYLGNAGTASRFLTTVCSLIESHDPNAKPTTLTGNARMKQRPIGPLVQALVQNGSKIKYMEAEGCFPLEITPSGLNGGVINLSASVSSQYVSSVLISAPYAKQPVVLDLSGDAVISQPYIDMTISMMKSFGIEVKREGTTNKYHIPCGVYTNPAEYLVEADASSATYPLAFAAITGSTVTVTNMGSKSLQGDSEFAVKVLQTMGCKVNQTETTTTVTGPKTLLPISSIDMETMTDAFMTAVVLAAVARNAGDGDQNTTKITGIANQRVKECDRIAAMIEQLARLGVAASELPDGLQIHGIDRSMLKNPAPSGIKCYDDHRIAMSFSILGCIMPPTEQGLIITEKKCVEKTWPSWWDTLENTLRIGLSGVDIQPPHTPVISAAAHSVDNTKSVVLIGMRGAGKTHMGRAGALHLGRKFIDMDHYLEAFAKQSIPEYVKANGWKAFRNLEAECLAKVLREHSEGFVVSCGGGAVEGADSRETLSKWGGLVVHIKRDIATVEEYLNIDKTRPMYGEDMRAVWGRREPWYIECSNSEFFVSTAIVDGKHDLDFNKVEKCFGRFLDFHLSSTPFEYPKTPLSFFVSLTDSNVAKTLSILDEISVGANALELRVDLLESQEIEFVGEQLAQIRLASSLPVVFTVRTKQQGGKYPDGEYTSMIKLLTAALRWGCEYVDVELSEPYTRFNDFLAAKRNSRIIASYHDPAGNDTWTVGGTMSEKYHSFEPFTDVVKLIGMAHSFHDNSTLHAFTSSLPTGSKPLIALLMGGQGQLSRSLNTFLTPVTHPLLASAAPGQVSISQIHQVRAGIGLLPAKKYCLFGTPIKASMSPTLHNTGFKTLGLPHMYELRETGDVETVREMMKEISGASVTIPLKIDVLKLCDYVDPAAFTIGAVNTLVNEGGRISGYNTDWLGIQRRILSHLPSNTRTIGVVIGAGGTARAALYALSQIEGMEEVRVWNRTHSKAQQLAQEFGAVAKMEFSSLLEGKDVQYVIVSTVPMEAQNSMDCVGLFRNGPSGIIVDMAYRPRITPLLQAAIRWGSWKCVEGVDVLLEQGFEQFETWTGYVAPRAMITKSVYEKYE